MSSRRRKREMWMWWLTPTCSTLLYYTRRKREKKKETRRERKITREWRVCTISLCVCLSLFQFLPPEWWVVDLFSLSVFVVFFFSNHHKKNTHTYIHAQFFSHSSRLMNSELLYSFSHANAALIILITHPTNGKNKKKRSIAGNGSGQFTAI